MAKKTKTGKGKAGTQTRKISVDGALLREIRELLGKKNEQRLGAFGIPYRSLSAYENNQRTPTLETLGKLFKAMRDFASVRDAIASKAATVTSESSHLARVLDRQRRIVASALDCERDGKFGRDMEAEQQMLGILEDKNPLDQALRDSFVGQAETANLKLEAELNVVRNHFVDLYRQQASNWIRNGRFIEAIKPLRELSRHVSLARQDKLMLVQALRSLSKEPSDEAGREIAALHAEAECTPHTTDWIDWLVSIGQTAYHYHNLAMAEAAFRQASEAKVEDRSKLAVPLGHLAVVLYRQAESNSITATEREECQEKARLTWEQVLKCLPVDRFPRQLAVTRMRLGNFWSHRPSGSKEESLSNLNQAFRHYEEARIIWERQNCAGELGAIEYTLADWELKRARLCDRFGENERHLKEAIRLCESAIGKLSPAAPDEWHNSHFNLAEALEALDAVVPAHEHLERAASAYQTAAEVYSVAGPLEYWIATVIPLCRVKASLAQRSPDDPEIRESLHDTLNALEAKGCDDTGIQRQVAAWREQFPPLGTRPATVKKSRSGAHTHRRR